MGRHGQVHAGELGTAAVKWWRRPRALVNQIFPVLPHEPVPPPLDQISQPSGDLPPGDYRLASSYLLPRGEVKRCIETLEAFAGARGTQSVEVELTAPGEGEWYLPLAFFDKQPVAPDLEVHDGAGRRLSPPTKLQNMALTERAFGALAAELEFDLDSDSELRALVHDVIFSEELRPRVARYLIRREAQLPAPLSYLLVALEDQFVLWAKAAGGEGEDHRFLVTRSLAVKRTPLFRRPQRKEETNVLTTVGLVPIALMVERGPPRLDLRRLFNRLLLALGTHVVTFAHETAEAARFASFHLRVTAPAGFTVREVIATGGLPSDGPDASRQRVPLATGANLTVQGNGSEMGHVHAALSPNPTPAGIRLALVLRSDLISFWALVVVLTAMLLWLFHHRDSLEWLYQVGGALETATTILLIVPSAASALALRAEEGGLVRRSMSLTRTTLFGSALLSIATALALLFPASDQTRVQLVGDFATVAYFLAIVISVTWVLARPWVWTVYRRVLTTRRNNLLVVAVLSLAMSVSCEFSDLPQAVTAAGLVIAGLGMAVIASNRMVYLRGNDSGLFPYLAAAGAVLAFAAAGIFAGYYDDQVSRTTAYDVLLWGGAALGALALVAAGRIVVLDCRNEHPSP